MTDQIATRAAALGWGVVMVANSPRNARGVWRQTKRDARPVFALGEQAVLSGAGGESGPGRRIERAGDLARALNRGALVTDAWGWAGVYASSQSPGGWVSAKSQLQLMEEACSLATKPFLAVLLLDCLYRAMASPVEAFVKAMRERAPKGSRLVLALPHYGMPQDNELPLGKGDWFDAIWIGRHELAGVADYEKAARSGWAEGLPPRLLAEFRGRIESGSLPQLSEGAGFWRGGGAIHGPLDFPYEPVSEASGLGLFDCAGAFLAESERDELLSIVSSRESGVGQRRRSL